jgi:hypothetical protein
LADENERLKNVNVVRSDEDQVVMKVKVGRGQAYI